MSYLINKLKQSSFAENAIRPFYRAAVYSRRRKQALELLEGVNAQTEKTLWYCGDPRHANLGDIAQKLCILDWAKTFFPSHEIVRIPGICFEYAGKEAISYIESRLSESDLFVFQSGYTMSDKHGDESFHRLIPQTFPEHSVLVMPQTIRYKTDVNLQKTADAFASSDKLVLLARDSVSYRTACEHFPDTFSALYPDIVTTLIGSRNYGDCDSREGVLFCLRNDSEKLYSPSELSRLIKNYEGRIPVSVTDTTKANLNPEASDEDLMKVVIDQIDEFAKYKVTVTDRFHGMIFSLIARTPVVVLATNDHKVITGADWFIGDPSFEIARADSPETAEALIAKYLSGIRSDHPTDKFRQRFYSELPALLEKRGFPISVPKSYC